MVIILGAGKRPGGARQAVQVIDIIAMACHHGMISITHHDEVTVVHRKRYIAPPVLGIQALVGVGSRLAHSIVVNLVQIHFAGRGVNIVLMGRKARPASSGPPEIPAA